MKRLLELFWTMLKIGLFTFGGGYAMIALLEAELVSKRGWLAHEEFMDVVAIAESTPGPIAINAATYVGYRRARVPGALVATVGICIPSFVIIFLISLFFDAFLSVAWVAAAFRGIRICVVFLILSAGIKMLRKMEKTAFSITVMTLTLIAMITLSLFAVSFSSIFYILIAGVLGLALYLVGHFGGKGDKNDLS